MHVHHRWAALHEPDGVRNLVGNWLQSVVKKNIEFGDQTYQYRGLQSMFMHRFSRKELANQLLAGGWKIDQLQRLSLNGSTVMESTGIAGGFIAVCTHR